MFTLDTESGFREAVFITASWGLGELVVQGAVNPDEFYVYKPALRAGRHAVIRRNLGSKASRMVYAADPAPGRWTEVVEVAAADRARFCIGDADVHELARQALVIESHYGCPMDIEWGKDGETGAIYVLQARPETVQSRAGRTDPPLLAETALAPAGAGPRDRPAHRRGTGPRRVRRARDVARAAGRRDRLRHDRPGLGAGHEAGRGHRHQPGRPHLPRGDHRARARHPGGRRLRRCHDEDPRRRPGHGVLRRGRHRRHLRRPPRLRAAAHRARRPAALARAHHDERRQPGPRLRLRVDPEPRRRARAPRVHHQPHDRRAPAGAARVRDAGARRARPGAPPDGRLRRPGGFLRREAHRRHRQHRRRVRARSR